jgi:aryl-alcohol dehydrogenase (NADP+)
VRYTAVSNYTGPRIREWIGYAQAAKSALPVAVQPHYNLVHRNEVEEGVVPVAEEFGLGLVPYSALASGFLTGKYRSTDATGQSSPRAQGAAKYATAQGLKIIDALEGIGKAHGVSIASTALAWLRAQPTVVAPIASASRVDQVGGLLDSARVDLTADEIGELTRLSEWNPDQG